MAAPRPSGRVVDFRPSLSSSDRRFWTLVQKLRRLKRDQPAAYRAVESFVLLKTVKSTR